MGIKNMDFDGFTFDDNELAKGAGINKITQAYSKVFENIVEIAQEGADLARAGSSKELAHLINKLTNKTSALVQLTQMDKKIVGPTGQIFNIFGQEIDDECDEDNSVVDYSTMSEEELEEELNNIIDGCVKVSITDATAELNKSKNITDDGLSYGDLDDIEW